MKKRIAAIVIAWLALSGITYPAILAEEQHIGRDDGFAEEHCRHEMGTSILFSLLPPIWLGAPFLTGFYEYGFQFNCSKDYR
jgi:hypothetical protein